MISITNKKRVTMGYAGRAVCIEDGTVAMDYPADKTVWEVTFTDSRYRGLCANYYLKQENADKFIRENGGDPDAM